MKAERALLAAYREWHRLAQAETKAIARRDWNFLLECQALIKNLQPPITRLAAEARAEWKNSRTDRTTKEEKFRPLVSELVELARRNQISIRAAREQAVTERGRWQRSVQNLKNLQQSYANVRPGRWLSFS